MGVVQRDVRVGDSVTLPQLQQPLRFQRRVAVSWVWFRLQDMQSVHLCRSVLICPVVCLFLSVLICPVCCLLVPVSTPLSYCPLVPVSTHLSCLLSTCSGQHSSVLFVVHMFRSVLLCPIRCPLVPVGNRPSYFLSACSGQYTHAPLSACSGQESSAPFFVCLF